jgi:energy-coupling factor transport system ATP-binding protein
VLRDVSLEVLAGSFFALVGPNGSGKTTLALHFAQILPVPPGRVHILGQDIATLPMREISEWVGYVFQNPEHQFVEQRVERELAYSLQVRGRPADEIEAVVEELLDSFGLAPYREANPFSLSQGQKRRLSVATMLALGQRVLVLDEPTFGQDRNTAQALMERLRALHREGVTILMITHDMQLVADYAERAAVMVQGEIPFVGLTGELFADEALLQAASLRPVPLQRLAQAMGIAYDDGTLPMSIPDWYPFFGVGGGATGGHRQRAVGG